MSLFSVSAYPSFRRMTPAAWHISVLAPTHGAFQFYLRRIAALTPTHGALQLRHMIHYKFGAGAPHLIFPGITRFYLAPWPEVALLRASASWSGQEVCLNPHFIPESFLMTSIQSIPSTRAEIPLRLPLHPPVNLTFFTLLFSISNFISVEHVLDGIYEYSIIISFQCRSLLWYNIILQIMPKSRVFRMTAVFLQSLLCGSLRICKYHNIRFIITWKTNYC